MFIEHLEALVLNLLPIVHKLCVRRYSDTKSSLKIKFHVYSHSHFVALPIYYPSLGFKVSLENFWRQ